MGFYGLHPAQSPIPASLRTFHRSTCLLVLHMYQVYHCIICANCCGAERLLYCMQCSRWPICDVSLSKESTRAIQITASCPAQRIMVYSKYCNVETGMPIKNIPVKCDVRGCNKYIWWLNMAFHYTAAHAGEPLQPAAQIPDAAVLEGLLKFGNNIKKQAIRTSSIDTVTPKDSLSATGTVRQDVRCYWFDCYVRMSTIVSCFIHSSPCICMRMFCNVYAMHSNCYSCFCLRTMSCRRTPGRIHTRSTARATRVC